MVLSPPASPMHSSSPRQKQQSAAAATPRRRRMFQSMGALQKVKCLDSNRKNYM
jgi:hypothetical protein